MTSTHKCLLCFVECSSAGQGSIASALAVLPLLPVRVKGVTEVFKSVKGKHCNESARFTESPLTAGNSKQHS